MAVGLALCLGSLLADRVRRRQFQLPTDGPPAVSDRRTVRQLRIQRGIAVAGGAIAVLLIYVGDREVDAGRAEMAELRATGIATVGRVVDRRPERWWVKNDDDQVTVAYRRLAESIGYGVKYDVTSLDHYAIGREVEGVYDPGSNRVIVDGRGFGVGEGPMGFIGVFGGIGVAAIAAYQLNSIRRVSRIVRSYPWVSEPVDTSEEPAGRIGFTRLYVSVARPAGRNKVRVRLAHGFRFRRRTLHGKTLRIAGNPLDDVAIDIPKSRLLVPAAPPVCTSAWSWRPAKRRTGKRRPSRKSTQAGPGRAPSSARRGLCRSCGVLLGR